MTSRSERLLDRLRDATYPSASASVIRFLVGRRFIDLPIRVLAVLDLIAGFSPTSMESFEPLYLVFHFSARVLTVVAAFAPLSAGLLAIVGFYAYLALFPQYLDQFQAPLAFSAAILLTHLRWVPSLVLSAAVWVLSWSAGLLGSEPGYALTSGMIFYDWVRNSVLALTAALVNARLEREIATRTEAAREHERSLQAERVGFAINTHDTVSQGLARQGRIISLLSSEVDGAAGRMLVSELAFTNDDTQQQLRAYMRTLDTESVNGAPVGAVAAECWDAWRESLQRAAEAGGLALAIEGNGVSPLPSDAANEELRLLLREMVTNLVKHAADPACTLRAHTDMARGMLVLETVNRADSDEARVSRSVLLRAARLSATKCEATLKAGTYRLVIELPEEISPK